MLFGAAHSLTSTVFRVLLCAMQRVEANEEWSLFCPNEAPGLADAWGADFEALYLKFERAGRAKKVIRAQQLWFAILDAQVLCSITTARKPGS